MMVWKFSQLKIGLFLVLFMLFCSFSVYAACPGGMTGDGTSGSPCQVTSWTDLNNTRNDLSANYILNNNLDSNSAGYDGLGNDWQPIANGTGGLQFNGTFNGQNFNISNLTINKPTKDLIGLFGYVRGNISNVNLLSVNISGASFVGGLVGRSDGSISNCSSSGSVNGDSDVGGLVGSQPGTGSIFNSSSDSSVIGTGYSVGGLVGSASGIISHSSSSGSVNGDIDVGGLVGTQQYGIISNSSSSGSVNGSSNIGGLVGFQNNYGFISDSYSIISGIVSGTDSVGSLVGYQAGALYQCSGTPDYSCDNWNNDYLGCSAYTFHYSQCSQLNCECYNLVDCSSYGNNQIDCESHPECSYVDPICVRTAPNCYSYTGNCNGCATDSYCGHTMFCTETPGLTCEAQNDQSACAAILDCTWTVKGTVENSYSIIESSGVVTGNSNAGFIFSEYGVVTTSYLTIRNQSAGSITFLDWNFTENISNNIIIQNNFVSINSTQYPGLNKSANITLINVPTNFANPIILKDGEQCSDCYNFTPLDAVTVMFNVSSWSNYSIGEIVLFDTNLDSYYEIHNCFELQSMNNNLSRNYELVNDIDCSDTINWNSGAGFIPVGNFSDYFTGNFTGNFFSISHLVINSSSSYTGLFSRAEQNIFNLVLFNISVTAQGNVGGLVGEQLNGFISNISLHGTIFGDTYVGGLVGYQYAGNISTSSSAGIVNSIGSNVGGLVGYQYAGTISDSYSNSSVSGSNGAGGLVSSQPYGTVINSYSVGNVTSVMNACGLICFSNGQVINSYWDLETSGQEYSGGGIGFTTATMFQYDEYDLWNFDTVWSNYYEGTNYPILQWQAAGLSDIQNPVITITTPENDTQYSYELKPTELNFIVTDNVGIDFVLYWDGTQWTQEGVDCPSGSTYCELTYLIESSVGSNTWTVNATDLSGNSIIEEVYFVVDAPPQEYFTFQIDTTLIDGETFSFAVDDASLSIDWGDDTSEYVSGTNTILHTYSEDGVYNISLNGTASQISIQGGSGALIDMLTNISPAITGLTSASSMFANTNNFGITPLTEPAFFDIASSNITDMNNMFYYSAFNQDISNWDVSNVINMEYMFYGSAFNQSIGNWDVSSVQYMNAMFSYSSFNQDISSWDVSSVTNMYYMFSTSPFNQDIGSWDVNSVIDMNSMFFNSPFDQNLNNWNVSAVTDMDFMFFNSQFNQDISNWCVSNIGSKPTEFDTNTPVGFENNAAVQPQWGTCSGSPVRFPICSQVTDISESECIALMAIYNATGGENWNTKTGWNSLTTACNWSSVTCTDGHVTQLWSESNNIIGAIPSDIESLIYLQTLGLPDNYLTSLPAEISNLINLEYLELSINNLTSISPEIGSLNNLHYLYLDYNLLNSIPSEISTLNNLEILYLTNNCLSESSLDSSVVVWLNANADDDWRSLNVNCEYIENCANYNDDDTDGNADCLDSDCDSQLGPNGETCEYGRELSCNDGSDNDGDGHADCADSDCNGLTGPNSEDCETPSELICNDGYDNDADGYTDCADSDCSVNCQFSGIGSGTAQDPYQITSWVELNEIRKNLSAYYILNGNLNSSSVNYTNIGNNWQPIGNETAWYNFSGNFNGQNYNISNLTVNKPTTDYVGLFGYVRGNISNINLLSANVSGKIYVGGLVGYQNSGSIINSSSFGSVYGETHYVGGLVGSSFGTISNCSSLGSVRGYFNYVGGLVGSSFGIISDSSNFANVTGNQDVGGLAGHSSGTISNSSSLGSVNGTIYVGGLVGYQQSGSISNSSSRGSVNGTNYVGGLVGYQHSGTISNSTSNGDVLGNSYIGALIGYLRSAAIVGNSSAILDSSSIISANSFVGFIGNNSGTVTNSFLTIRNQSAGNITFLTWNVTGNISNNIIIQNNFVSIDSSNYPGLNKSANITLINVPTTFENPVIYKDNVICTDCYNFTDLNAGTVIFNVSSWSNYTIAEILPLFAGGNGTINNPYQITSWTQLNSTRLNLSAHYILNQSLSASDSDYVGLGNNWTPIGNLTHHFNGTFNGNNYVISNLTINKPTTDYIGLFGVTRGNISHVNLLSANVSGQSLVGCLVGWQQGSTISTSSCFGSVVGIGFVGGLVGSSIGTVSNSSSSGSVTGSSSYVGGLVGVQNSGTIGNSSSSGNVTSFSGSVGGLVGVSSGTIDNCSSSGSVNGTEYVGGLVGYHVEGGIIFSSSSSGNVNGTQSVGGLVGYQTFSTISDSSSSGDVTGSEYVGGLVGHQADGFILNSYSIINGTVSGTDYVGSLVGYQVGSLLPLNCSGNEYSSCNSFISQDDCQSNSNHNGNCAWGSEGLCTGIPNACSSYYQQSDCGANMYHGSSCTWNVSCLSYIDHSCSNDYSEQISCENSGHGCSWIDGTCQTYQDFSCSSYYYNEYDCINSGHGCYWNVDSCYGSWQECAGWNSGTCSGSWQECSDLNYVCMGDTVSCSNFYDLNDCTNENGCSWFSNSPHCSGSNSCNNVISKSGCQAESGCIWTVKGTIENSYSIIDSSATIFGNSNVNFIVSENGIVTNSYLIIQNISAGNITFIDWNITGNISNNIIIQNNFVSINSTEFPGLNKSANITLINMPANFIDPVMYKDNVIYTTYYNFTSLNTTTVKFNVSSWSSYHIDERTEIFCDDLIDNDLDGITDCSNHGTCVASTTCLCSAGFTADNCEININDCSPNPCQNGGTCVDGINSFTCICSEPYHGTTCSGFTCQNVNECSNNGRCISQDTCECYPSLGYYGASCNQFNCSGVNNCSGHGECIAPNLCSCNTNYTGTDCSISLTIPVVNNTNVTNSSIPSNQTDFNTSNSNTTFVSPTIPEIIHHSPSRENDDNAIDDAIKTITPIIEQIRKYEVTDPRTPSGDVNTLPSSIATQNCIPNWLCTEWSTCDKNIMSRSCSDLNGCESPGILPEEEKACSSITSNYQNIHSKDLVLSLGKTEEKLVFSLNNFSDDDLDHVEIEFNLNKGKTTRYVDFIDDMDTIKENNYYAIKFNPSIMKEDYYEATITIYSRGSKVSRQEMIINNPNR